MKKRTANPCTLLNMYTSYAAWKSEVLLVVLPGDNNIKEDRYMRAEHMDRGDPGSALKRA